MRYSELVEAGDTGTQCQDHLAGGKPTSAILRIPKNLKEAVTITARLHGASFPDFIRSCVIDESTRRSS